LQLVYTLKAGNVFERKVSLVTENNDVMNGSEAGVTVLVLAGISKPHRTSKESLESEDQRD
jgi:hypothetical protein